MRNIHYLTNQKEQTLIEDATLGFDWVTATELLPDEPFDSTYKCRIDVVLYFSETALHILLRTDQEELIHQDRAYQNGDGFHFVLANPNGTNTTDEFYVIGISPLDNTWKNRFIWYKNVDLDIIFLKNSVVNVIKKDRYVIHTMVPFTEIEPIHGYFMSHYGFNISYVQNHPKGKNVYILTSDSNIQSEQSYRRYLEYNFETPKPKGNTYHCRLTSKHGPQQVSPILECIICTTESCEVCICVDDKVEMRFQIESGMTKKLIEIPRLQIGHYEFNVALKIGTEVKSYTLLYDVYDLSMIDEIQNDVEALLLTDVLPVQSQLTLLYDIKNLMENLMILKPYESFETIMMYFNKISEKLNFLKRGHHLFFRQEVIRLAHRSKLDNTLQPYSLYLPETINDGTLLLVYLHGSGTDDTSLSYAQSMHQFAEEINAIILAPYARGTSHFYCTDEAIQDILELTLKIKSWFHIEEKNILLSGFSMGGYGVYRLLDAGREIYKKGIVLSGHCSYGKNYGGPDYNEMIDRLPLIPMIIFHGEQDKNCDYEDQIEFFQRLMLLNSQCQVVTKDDEGHSGLISEWYHILVDWMNNHREEVS